MVFFSCLVCGVLGEYASGLLESLLLVDSSSFLFLIRLFFCFCCWNHAPAGPGTSCLNRRLLALLGGGGAVTGCL